MAAGQGHAEGFHRGGRGALELLFLDGVVGDEVHVALEAPQQGGQCRGMARLVVEPPEQDVFKAHPPARDRHVAAAILQQIFDRIGVGGGDQFLPQPLIRGMEAHRQGELGAAQPI